MLRPRPNAFVSPHFGAPFQRRAACTFVGKEALCLRASHAGNGGKTRKKHTGATALRELAVSTISADAILELIEKLGLKDLLVTRLRARLEDADVDGLIDDAFDYVRRNPEVLVILLGTITVATGAIVFLDQRRGKEMEFEEMTPVARMPARSSERRRSAR